jgi:hypothetical protein
MWQQQLFKIEIDGEKVNARLLLLLLLFFFTKNQQHMCVHRTINHIFVVLSSCYSKSVEKFEILLLCEPTRIAFLKFRAADDDDDDDE